jgi:hypothetical protein
MLNVISFEDFYEFTYIIYFLNINTINDAYSELEACILILKINIEPVYSNLTSLPK